MLRTDKEQIVAELTARLRDCEALIVADYRGLTNTQLLTVRSKLRDQGATFTVVKNTLTRRAAEAAGADALLAMLEGPTAIAFIEAGGNSVAVAKALADAARETKILTLRGGMLSGKPISGPDVEELAKLPPLDILKGQVLGVIIAPLTQLVGLLNAPLQNLVGLIDARIAQLDDSAGTDVALGAEEAAGEPAVSVAVEDAIKDEEAPVPEPIAEPEVDAPAAEASEDTEPEKNEEE